MPAIRRLASICVSSVLLAALLMSPQLVSGQSAAPASGQSRTVPEPSDGKRRRLVARRATAPVQLDGRLTEPDWLAAPVARAFVRVRPDYDTTTAYPSEVRVLFDDRYLYVAAFNRDSGGSAFRVPDLRRDFDATESDLFGITIGSLGDRRTAFQFQVNPLGSQSDVQAFDGGDAFNFNWDAVWLARTSRTDSGWVAEMAIPWTSLRYSRNVESWDLNLVRNARRALQWSAWMPYPRQMSSWRLSYAGLLDSLEPPPPRVNVRVRPYALGQTSRDPARLRDGRSIDLGGEVMWAPTANSLLEGTINTDFAQADVDRQVVNLTRFNVFFPERRQFFLENADLLNAGGLTGRFVVQPFFSRRIGLSDDGTPRTIDGGLRYAYRSGRTTAGVLAMRQGAYDGEGPSTFGVARASRFLGRTTRAGVTIAARRDGGVNAVATRENVVAAVDGFTRLSEQVQAGGMISTSTLDGRTGVGATYFVGRESPRLYTGILGALITENYTPQTGFVSRANVLLTSPAATLTLQPAGRPANVVWVRPGITTYFYQDPTNGRLQEGVVTLRSEVLHTNGASWSPFIEHNLQRPDAMVSLLPGVTVAPGTHDYWRYGANLKSDQSAAVSATANLSTGTFLDGGLNQAVLGMRWSPSPYAALLVSYEWNRLRGVGEQDSTVTTHLAAPEVRLFLNPRVQWSAFYQHNTVQERGTVNARFSWEFAPLSFVYVVYTDRRAINGARAEAARSLIVKLSWLRQF